ncbi:MAG TPA: FecR domain-containing protein, partial [Bryobacteraceae bacterium]|nr:FecR domain-containing protein [Bryobacteraceae bacterium]
ALVGAASAWGQSAISAHSGMVNYTQGRVLLDGSAVQSKFGQLPQVKNNQTLATEEGRAEVLLTPGVFVRLSENSSFKMLSNQLSDTALEVVSGSALFEVDELLKGNAITVKYKDASMALEKHGLYRIDADQGTLRVYDGEVRVTSGGKSVAAKKGRQVALTSELAETHFDRKDTDPFYRWAERRSEYIATANVSSAHSAIGSGLFSSGFGAGLGTWAWNPWFGLFTYLPGSGYGYNPFGWAFYSPFTVGYLFMPRYYSGRNSSSYPNYSSGRSSLAGSSAAGPVAPQRATPGVSSRGSFGGGGGGFASAGPRGGSVGMGGSRGGGGAAGGGASRGGGGRR